MINWQILSKLTTTSKIINLMPKHSNQIKSNHVCVIKNYCNIKTNNTGPCLKRKCSEPAAEIVCEGVPDRRASTREGPATIDLLCRRLI